MGEELLPGEHTLLLSQANLPIVNPLQLAGRDACMLFGTIAIPKKPDNRPDNSDDPEQEKGCTPAPNDNHRRNHAVGQSASQSRARGRDRLGEPALRSGKPAREGSRRTGKGSGFAGSKQKANHNEGGGI